MCSDRRNHGRGVRLDFKVVCRQELNVENRDMKPQRNARFSLCLLGLSFLLFIAPLADLNAQRSYDLSFVEIGVGTRQFSEVPTDVFVRYDSIYEPIDFGAGKPLVLTFGAVFLPE